MFDSFRRLEWPGTCRRAHLDPLFQGRSEDNLLANTLQGGSHCRRGSPVLASTHLCAQPEFSLQHTFWWSQACSVDNQQLGSRRKPPDRLGWSYSYAQCSAAASLFQKARDGCQPCLDTRYHSKEGEQAALERALSACTHQSKKYTARSVER